VHGLLVHSVNKVVTVDDITHSLLVDSVNEVVTVDDITHGLLVHIQITRLARSQCLSSYRGALGLRECESPIVMSVVQSVHS
jgi:hypothetical protein